MFYKRHIFFCTNVKKDDGGCSMYHSDDAFIAAKKFLQDKDSWGSGKFRASKSGCLGQCDLGPVCVVYPDGVWYSYVDTGDVLEILDKHVLNGQIIERLQLKQES